MSPVLEAVIGAAAASVIGGVGVSVRTLFAMRRDVRSFSPTLRALVVSMSSMIAANRCQNQALREIGANGSTERSDQCLDEADKSLSGLLAEKVGGETK